MIVWQNSQVIFYTYPQTYRQNVERLRDGQGDLPNLAEP